MSDIAVEIDGVVYESTGLRPFIHYVIFDAADGRILQVGAAFEMWEVKAIADAFEKSYLVCPGTIGEAVEMFVGNEGGELGVYRRQLPPIEVSKSTIAADDIDAAVLTGIPEGATMTIDGSPHEIAGGELSITSPMPATYRLACSHWPYLDWEATVEAVG